MLAEGSLAGRRRHHLLHLNIKACDQGAVLSCEDMSILLTTSPATIKRYVRALRQQGFFVITRGWKQDTGPGLFRKTQIIDLYLKGYQFTQIEQNPDHSETQVLCYLKSFAQVIGLHPQLFSSGQLRVLTCFSDKLIKEDIELSNSFNTSTTNVCRCCLVLKRWEKKETPRAHSDQTGY